MALGAVFGAIAVATTTGHWDSISVDLAHQARETIMPNYKSGGCYVMLSLMSRVQSKPSSCTVNAVYTILCSHCDHYSSQRVAVEHTLYITCLRL